MKIIMKTGSVVILAISLMLTLSAAPASAQDIDARVDRIRTGLPEQAASRIEAQVERARAAGLPVEPILDKAVEGIAKGVPANLIVGAVTRLSGELGRASALLGEGGIPPVPADVAAVADALRRGVPEPALRRVIERAGPREPVALSVHTVGDLIDRGVPADQALTVLEAWRGRGGQTDELRELPTAVERLIRQGILPGQAAAAVAGAMQGGGPPGGNGMGHGPGAQGAGPPGGGPPIPPGAGPPSQRGQTKGGPPGQTKPPGGGPPGGS